MKIALVAALLAFPAGHTQASPFGEVDMNLAARNPEAAAKAVAQKILRANHSDYRAVAVSKLRDKDEYFDHGRVEVTGFMSSDDTSETLPGLADMQIKPSFSADESDEYSGPGAAAWKRIKRNAYPVMPAKLAAEMGALVLETGGDSGADFSEVAAAMRGEVTKNAKEKLAGYKGKEIKEILAHSWGTEFIYAAILNGDILPPKKLIVVGVPDDDHAKWETLAEMTGTEVHWIRADNDKVAKTGAKLASFTVAAHGVNFEVLWREACRARPATCPAHERQSKGVSWDQIGDNPGLLGHDRMAYFEILKKPDVNVIKGTRDEFRSAQDALIKAEIREAKEEALADALREARELVARALEQAGISRRDHDQRLRDAYLALAVRTCAEPGSVTQAELNALAKPYDKDFVAALPEGVSDCNLQVYGAISRGEAAFYLESVVRPQPVAVVVRPNDPPPAPPVVALPLVIGTPFNAVLWRLKNYAIYACANRGYVPFPQALIDPPVPYSFYPGTDDYVANSYSGDPEACETKLFRRLFEVIRTGQGDRLTAQWVQQTIASYPVADTTPQYIAPPSGWRPPSGGDPCRDNGNIYCP